MSRPNLRAKPLLSTVRRTNRRVYWRRRACDGGLVQHTAWSYATDHTGREPFRWDIGVVWTRADGSVSVEHRGVSSEWLAQDASDLAQAKALIAENADRTDAPKPSSSSSAHDRSLPVPPLPSVTLWNITYSPSTGTYIGRGRGQRWQVRRGQRRTWIATSTDGTAQQCFGSLEEVSRWLEARDA